MISPYRTVLGPDYERLAPTLREFHNEEPTWQGDAIFRITRGKGILRNLVAWLGGLPPAGEKVPVHLACTRETNQGRTVEYWDRDFDGFRLRSRQWAEGKLLLERFGWITMAFHLETEPRALRLRVVKAWVAGIPLPGFLAPKGEGLEGAGKEGTIQVTAKAFAPLLGQIVFVTKAH